MNDELSYKGFTSTPKYSAADGMFYGTLDGIEDIVIYDAARSEGLEAAFIEAVDDYLENSPQARGKTKNAPCPAG